MPGSVVPSPGLMLLSVVVTAYGGLPTVMLLAVVIGPTVRLPLSVTPFAESCGASASALEGCVPSHWSVPEETVNGPVKVLLPAKIAHRCH